MYQKFLALDFGKVILCVQELDFPVARNESFKAKSTREVADIATIGFEHQSTKFKELTQ